MAYLQKRADTHGVPEEELANRWDLLSSMNGRRTLFLLCATAEDSRKCDDVVEMELGYLSEVCSEKTLQRVVTYLAKNWEDNFKVLEHA